MFRFCLLSHQPPQPLKLRRHQGKHDGHCRPLQKEAKSGQPSGSFPKIAQTIPLFWCNAFGLLPSAYGLRPMAYGLRPLACGLRPTAYGLRPSASLIKMCWANRAIHIWFPILLGTNWLKGESRLRKICKQGTVWGQIQRARAQRGCMVIIYPPCSLFPHKTPLPTIAIHNPINICFLAHDTDTKGV